jgi:hypothetical protein
MLGIVSDEQVARYGPLLLLWMVHVFSQISDREHLYSGSAHGLARILYAHTITGVLDSIRLLKRLSPGHACLIPIHFVRLNYGKYFTFSRTVPRIGTEDLT